MKMKAAFAIVSACLAMFSTSTVQAKEFAEGNYVACLTEDLLDQFISASVDQDMQGIKYLLGNGCVMPRAGIKVSVLDRTWTGTTQVRAYVGDQAVELWTVNEAITD